MASAHHAPGAAAPVVGAERPLGVEWSLSGRAGEPWPRRRAALAPGGHATGAARGFDGEVCVRYEAIYRRAELASGERRLLLAVLEDGIRTLLKNAHATRGRGLNLQREALGWLTTAARVDVFAFESICDTLGVDARRLRARVLAEAERVPDPVR
jgi:hypothetical protein